MRLPATRVEERRLRYGRFACVGSSTGPALDDVDSCAAATGADLQQVNTNPGGACPLFVNCIRGILGDDVDKFTSVESVFADYDVPLPEA